MALSLDRMRARLQSDLTARALEAMRPGDILTDKRNPGFRARRQGTGAPVLELRYRHGGKRRTAKLGAYRRHPNDSHGMPPWTVIQALGRYHEHLDTLARKQDPQAVIAAKVDADERKLEPALEAYEQSLIKRQVVKRGEVTSLLRRELVGTFGNIPLEELTLQRLVKRIDAIEADGMPGKARELRTRSRVFLGWCAAQGLVRVNPFTGWRAPRKTRAERIKQHGRALEPWELPIVWRALCEAKGAKGDLGPYLLVRLLTGQRRSETAAMRWRDLNLEAGVWTIPPEVGKTAEDNVPLPRLVRVILQAHRERQARHRRLGDRVFFPHVKDPDNIGWSKLMKPIYAATKAAGMPDWMPGDLRKTFRTGLEDELGVPVKLAELMIGHGPRDELERRYSRAKHWPARKAAARRWALHVLRAVRA